RGEVPRWGRGVDRRRTSSAAGVAAVAACLLLGGCGLTMPSDPDGTLERVQGAVLRVGVSEEPGLIEHVGTGAVSASRSDAAGPLAELITGFASEQQADVEWVFASEESLVRGLESGRIDVAVGGMTAD